MHVTHFLSRTFFAVSMGVMAICAGFIATPVSAETPVISTAKTAAKPAGYGAHGMAVFGGVDGLYASHLPMFHRPHDVQLVFRFRLSDAMADAALRKHLSTKPALWTLDPEKFDLYRFAPQHAEPLTQFQARFVEGHFERGGVEKFAKQMVVVDEVIVYRKLDLTKRAETAGHYLKIGAQREQFLIKLIDRRPDFDIIVALSKLKTPENRASTATKKDLVLMPDALQPPVLSAVTAALSAQGFGQFDVAGIIYFETDDLK